MKVMSRCWSTRSKVQCCSDVEIQDIIMHQTMGAVDSSRTGETGYHYPLPTTDLIATALLQASTCRRPRHSQRRFNIQLGPHVVTRNTNYLY